MPKPWLKKTSEILFENPWWTYRKDSVEVPGYGLHDYYYAETPGSSMVIPLTPAGKLILVQQFRYLGGRDSLEFPCGGVKPEHDPMQTAHLELAEEAGRKASKMHCIGEFNPWNGAAKETCQVYLATGLEPTQAQADPTEDIECFEYTPAELDQLIRQGQVWDGMTLAAWLLARDAVFEIAAGLQP